MITFREIWSETAARKNSVLCAGLDPAEFAMGRGEKGLPAGVDKREWALRYIEAVAPFCAAVKPNIQYWKKPGNLSISSKGDMQNLMEISHHAHSLGLVVIEDSKLADIGSTNDAGVYHAQEKVVNAVTFSPFAGNMQEATEQAHKRGLGLISMVLMSNPEYEREKNKLVPISPNELNDYPNFIANEIVKIDDRYYIPQYIQLAHDANKFGVDGIVIGAPSKKNHIRTEEIHYVRSCTDDEMLVLLPGVGAQGGEAGEIWKYFNKDNVIVNVGRALMLPKGSNSIPQDQAETARQYRDMLNELRTKNN